MATSSTSTTVTTQAPLMYAPPTMNSPTIVDLAMGALQDWRSGEPENTGVI